MKYCDRGHAMNKKIEPVSGFPEFLPAEQIAFNRAVAVIRRNYELTGAVPIETPAIERASTLLAKGGNDKEIYGLRRLSADEGGDVKDLALHFDLTVPLARYVAQHQGKLIFPFRRHQIQPVWRGERAQQGRYRQFYQCDIDVIGENELSLLNDAEMPYVIYRIFEELEIGKFLIRVNNRKVLKGFLASFGLEENIIKEAVSIIDSIEKIGEQETKAGLAELGVADAHIDELLSFFTAEGSTSEILSFLDGKEFNEIYKSGVEELRTVTEAMKNLGIPEEYFTIDLKIARGLDYYTGTVYETRLLSHPELGSICSGGRYDELTGLFTAKKYPGVGISIGLTRLLPALMAEGIIPVPPPTVAPVLVTVLQPEYIHKYLGYVSILRASGINTEIYLEPKKLNAQMRYANRKGFKLVIVAGENEFNNSSILVKNMQSGEQVEVAESTLVENISDMLTTA